jgi:DNA-binding transcriptional LysR family regulator
MTSPRLPSLNAIASFEAVARHRSFTKAATELYLTQSAVSKQIQQLELRIGTTLFLRKNTELELTPSGTILLKAVSQNLANLRDALRDIDKLKDPCVTIKASVGVAAYFLVPYVARFRSRHPTANVRIIASDSREDREFSDCDLAILYGQGDWPGVTAFKVADERVFAACSPTYRAELNLSSLTDLVRCSVIELESDNPHTLSVRRWLRRMGCMEPHSGPRMHVSNYDLSIKAATRGQGVALLWAEATPDEFLDGRLVQACDGFLATGKGEYLAYPSERGLSPSAELFWSWTLETPMTYPSIEPK